MYTQNLQSELGIDYTTARAITSPRYFRAFEARINRETERQWQERDDAAREVRVSGELVQHHQYDSEFRAEVYKELNSQLCWIEDVEWAGFDTLFVAIHKNLTRKYRNRW